MKLLNYFTSIRPAINAIFLGAIASIIAMEGWLNSIPEIVSWGSEFGRVYYKICLSIISSYVFYFLVVHIKSEQDKENIGVFVSGKIKNIISIYKSQICALKKATSNTSEEVYLEKNEIESIFTSINPNSEAPLLMIGLGNYANWLQYLDYHKSRTQSHIQKVFLKMPFLESKLVALLAELDDCSHFIALGHTINMQLNNPDMSSWAGGFYDYSLLCKKLDGYHEKYLAHHLP